MGLNMAHQFGIFLRSNNYYLRVVLPKDHPLNAQYKSGKIVIRIAGTTFREAQLNATLKRAEILSNQFVIPKAKKRDQNKPLTSKCYLSDIFNRWKESQLRSHDSINACQRSLTLYEEYTLNPHIKDLTRAQGDGFRGWLQHPDRKTSSKTARDRLTWIKSLLNYAAIDLELLNKNPWHGINLKYSTTQKRRPWKEDELNVLLGSDLFTKRQPPKDWRAGEIAAFWVPLLGLYTGARLTELIQLRTSDIKAEGNINYIEITNEGANQQVKTDASIRKIPIHSKLIALGFLEYANELNREGCDSLWPKLPFRKHNAGGYFSNWFGEYRRSLELEGYPDFHCFRHTVRTKLLEAEIREHTIDMLLGHQVKGSTGARVYSHRTISMLKDAIECLAFESVVKLLE
jgi:integrase